MDEQRVDLQAQLDQIGAMLRDLAPQIAGYYKALLAADVPEEFAETLTMQLNDAWLRKAFPREGQD